jgi:mannose-6-phosphate isomerase-like protein (cupin superfamily)
MTSGTLAITASDGTSTSELRTGQAYARPAGAEHDVRNANAFEFVFIEIEILG